jgi:hypothetical protein
VQVDTNLAVSGTNMHGGGSKEFTLTLQKIHNSWKINRKEN